LLQAASRHYYRQLLDDGLELYEWTKSTLHAKTAVVDDDWATVGSYNLNWRSMFHNLECNLIMEDETAASALEDMFWEDVAQSAVVDHSFLLNRDSVSQLAGRMASAFRYWL
jgi:cardiolipin synthase